MQTLGEDRILIRPDDYLVDIPEFPDNSEPRARCRLFVNPYSINAIEVCEANYFAGNRVPYHEHEAGYETFLIDGGAIEIHAMGKYVVAKKGDLVHIPPYMPHSIKILEDNSIWRGFLQEIFMVQMMYDEFRLRAHTPNPMDDPEFRKKNTARHKSMFYSFVPYDIPVPAEEVPTVRPYDFGFAKYQFNGIDLRLKVGRWETHGSKEVWQMRMKKGYTISWDGINPYDNLFDVFSGSVEVTLEGHEPFIANARDLLRIPKWIAGKFTMLEDTVLLDVYCQGALLRSLDELNGIKASAPEKLVDKDFVKSVFEKNDYFNYLPLA